MFGISTIRIKNGFDFNRMRLRRVSDKTDEINIVMCALMERWHGYERLIKGLGDYYRRGGMRVIKLHFVGDGSEIPMYRKLAEQEGIADDTIFYGSKKWDEIPEIYDACNLAASSLGVYKNGIDYLCALKMREYFAAGLPFIGAAKLDVQEYEELRPYVRTFPNDSTPILIEDVIEFFDGLYKHKNKAEIKMMAKKIRENARRYLNMERAMDNVINYIEEGR